MNFYVHPKLKVHTITLFKGPFVFVALGGLSKEKWDLSHRHILVKHSNLQRNLQYYSLEYDT